MPKVNTDANGRVRLTVAVPQPIYDAALKQALSENNETGRILMRWLIAGAPVKGVEVKPHGLPNSRKPARKSARKGAK